ncbi:hypothetical protein KKB18_05980 [bacterium]|nr:hypothetical protein [bacterium]
MFNELGKIKTTALSFKCRICNENIVVRYLTKGEVAKCKSCGSENIDPENVIEVDDLSYEDYIKDAIEMRVSRV